MSERMGRFELYALVEATSTPEYAQAWSRAMRGLPLTVQEQALLDRAAELRRKAGLDA